MVNVITKICSICKTEIVGVGQDNFNIKWTEHLKTHEKKPDFKESAIKSNTINNIKSFVEKKITKKKSNK